MNIHRVLNLQLMEILWRSLWAECGSGTTDSKMLLLQEFMHKYSFISWWVTQGWQQEWVWFGAEERKFHLVQLGSGDGLEVLLVHPPFWVSLVFQFLSLVTLSDSHCLWHTGGIRSSGGGTRRQQRQGGQNWGCHLETRRCCHCTRVRLTADHTDWDTLKLNYLAYYYFCSNFLFPWEGWSCICQSFRRLAWWFNHKSVGVSLSCHAWGTLVYYIIYPGILLFPCTLFESEALCSYLTLYLQRRTL